MYLYNKILIVDDEPDELLLFRRAIGELSPDLSLITADSALHGLAKVAGTPAIDLIFVDLNMTGMDGFQYLDALRQEPANNHIPCIIWTSAVSDAHRPKAMKLGAAAFYIKPTTYDLMKKMMRDILTSGFSA